MSNPLSFDTSVKQPSPLVTFNDGMQAPQIGFGVYELSPFEYDCHNAVLAAIEAGYRHFDTAQHYYNEHSMAYAMQVSGVPREQFFVTTKTPWNITRRSILAEVEASLIRCNFDYFDLYLIHWPTGDVVEAWNAMEELKAQGKVKSIGVSNFTIRRFEEVFFKAGCSTPAVNQIEFHPYYQQPELVDYCRSKNIRIMAYSPLARSEVAAPEELQAIAHAVGRSPQQVMLRWSLQQGNIILPKSRNKERMRQNLYIDDFSLSDEQMGVIKGLDKNQNVLTFRPGDYY